MMNHACSSSPWEAEAGEVVNLKSSRVQKNKTNHNGRCLSFQECAARGEDYEKVKLLEISAEDAERWERRKKRKNPDLGFSGTADLCWPLLY